MATVYSLVAWGGATGKSVAVSSSTDYVTLTYHGLRNGMGVQFVSGTLPAVAGTALSLNTTYYAKYISTSTFELYYDSGLTSKIDFTSTGASLVLKGAYYQSLTNTSRWTGGIYDSLVAWNSGRSAASAFDEEVCELGEAFDDWNGNSPVDVNVPAASVLITASIGGARTPAFHNGVIDNGYVLNKTRTSSVVALTITSIRTVIDGFSVRFNGGGNYSCRCVGVSGLYSVASRIIAKGEYSLGYTGETGFTVGVACSADRCVAYGLNVGFSFGQYNDGQSCANCLAAACDFGFYASYTSNVYGYFYNNLAIGNVTNWGAQPTGITVAAGNAGAGAWVTAGYAAIAAGTSDVVDYANKDFRPALATSPQVDAGVQYYGYSTADITDAEVPNYNNGGSEAVDIGCYEYDHGYGNHPATATISLTNIVSGSRVLITRDDTSAVLYNDVPGSSLSFVTGYIGNFSVVIRKASESPYYREFSAGGTTVADQTTSIKALQQLDE